MKWKELLDGQWKEQPECGCVLPKIKLRIHHRSAIDPTHITQEHGSGQEWLKIKVIAAPGE